MEKRVCSQKKLRELEDIVGRPGFSSNTHVLQVLDALNFQIEPKRKRILMSKDPIFVGDSSQFSESNPDEADDIELTPKQVAIIGIRSRWYTTIMNNGFDLKRPTEEMYSAMLDRAATEMYYLDSRFVAEDLGGEVRFLKAEIAKLKEREAGWVRELYEVNARCSRLYKSREHFKEKVWIEADRFQVQLSKALSDKADVICDLKNEVFCLKEYISTKSALLVEVIDNDEAITENQLENQDEPEKV